MKTKTEPETKTITVLKAVGSRVGGFRAGETVEVPIDIADDLINSGRGVLADVVGKKRATAPPPAALASANKAVETLAHAIENDDEVKRLVGLRAAKGAQGAELRAKREELETRLREIDYAAGEGRKAALAAELDAGAEPVTGVSALGRDAVVTRTREIDVELEGIAFQLSELDRREAVARRSAFGRERGKLMAAIGKLRDQFGEARAQMRAAESAAQDLHGHALAYGLDEYLDIKPLVTTCDTGHRRHPPRPGPRT